MNSTTQAKGLLTGYISGFILSIVLTLLAYALVVHHLLNNWTLVFVLVGLAVTQLAVQLIFFLHLSDESKPRWNLLVFLFMVVVLTIFVFGTLWIMNNLNYNHNYRSPQDTNTYIIKDEGVQY